MGLYCMENYRTNEQLAEMRELETEGLCLFCPDVFLRRARQEILWETEHWTVIPNEFPYKGTALHLLAVPHEHATDLLDLTSAAQHDLWNALTKIRERFDLKYYGLGVRNGDCKFTGATIAHVHAHVLVGDAGSADEVPVRMRFSSRPPTRSLPSPSG